MTHKNSATCLSVESLQKLAHDELPPAEVAEIEAHLGTCAKCRSLLDSAEADPDWQRDILGLRSAPERPPASVELDDAASDEQSMDDVLRLLGPTDDPHKLGRIGPYEVVGIVGRGGMGVVFKAFDTALNRLVAIKMLLPHLAATGAARKRFAREGQAAAAVMDDHVSPIYSVAEWQGVPYIVTQFSRGGTLQTRIRDRGPLELKEILRIGMQTSRGLAAAHAQGLVHRDVKPSNILMDGTVERAMLTDFGLARAVDDASITRTGLIAGTPQYMSPEQARGGSVDARSDQFGLGCVLYAMCTGRPPFRADNSYAILRQITDEDPRPIRDINPDIPKWLCVVILRLMAKSPDERFESAQSVAAVLEKCLAHVQQPSSAELPPELQAASGPGPIRILHCWTRRTWIGLAGLATILLGGLFIANTAAPDITGDWHGEDWGEVSISRNEQGQLRGSFSDLASGNPGEFELHWSRIERRFNGAWREGDARFGELSLREVDKDLRGAYTTDAKSRVNPATPKLADLKWTREAAAQGRTTGESKTQPGDEQGGGRGETASGTSRANEQKGAELPALDVLRAQVAPINQRIVEAQERTRRLEVEYLRDSSHALELSTALDELARARHELQELWKRLNPALNTVRLDQDLAQEVLNAANNRVESVGARHAKGAATAAELAQAIEGVKQASKGLAASKPRAEAYLASVEKLFTNLFLHAEDGRTPFSWKSPVVANLDLHPDVALAWLEAAMSLKLEFVQFDDLNLWHKGALRVRESGGRCQAGDLIVVLNQHTFDSPDEAVAALAFEQSFSFDDIVLRGGLSGNWVKEHFVADNFERFLKPGVVSQAMVHFEIRVRQDGEAGVHARYPFGVCVSPEGLFVIPVASKSLVRGEVIVAIEGHKGTANVVAADDQHGLTLVKLNSPTERLFSWVKCRAGQPAVGQRFESVKGSNTIFELVASAVDQPYPAPFIGDDAIIIEAPVADVGVGAQLMAKDRDLQGIVVATVPSPSGKDEPQSRDPDRHFAVPSARIQKLIDQYRASSAASGNTKRATDQAEPDAP